MPWRSLTEFDLTVLRWQEEKGRSPAVPGFGPRGGWYSPYPGPDGRQACIRLEEAGLLMDCCGGCKAFGNFRVTRKGFELLGLPVPPRQGL